MNRLGIALALAMTAALADAATAQVVLPTNDNPGSFQIEARARNGRTGFEAVLFTPGNPGPASPSTQLNPVGAPVWKFGLAYDFRVKYEAATGTTTFGINFNRQSEALTPFSRNPFGDREFTLFGGSQEATVSRSPSLAGTGFRFFNVFGTGAIKNGTEFSASVIELNVNQDSLEISRLNTLGQPGQGFSQSFSNDDGSLFGDLDVTGQFIFSGNAGSDERPRLWFRLGGPERLALAPSTTLALASARFASFVGTTPFNTEAAVPEPASWAMLIAGFGLVGGAMRRRADRTAA